MRGLHDRIPREGGAGAGGSLTAYLEWQLKYGDKNTQAMFELVYRDTGQLHPALAAKPALRRDCLRYYEVFTALGASRIWTQVGPQPFQISEVLTLVEAKGIENPETKMKYLRLVQRMDRVELMHHMNKRAS